MNFNVSYHTDIGITKDTNQDALVAKVVETKKGKVAFGVVCDGMGGLSRESLPVRKLLWQCLIGLIRILYHIMRTEDIVKSY